MHSRRADREDSARRLQQLGAAGRVRQPDDTDVLPPLTWELDEQLPVAARAPAGRHRSNVPGGAPGLSALAARLSLDIDPGRRAAVVVGVVAVLVAVATGVWVLSSRPHAVALSSSPAAALASTRGLHPSPAGASGAIVTPAATGLSVVVDVAGTVRRPGIYTLPPGSRVYDAIKAAGGAAPGVSLTALNLAARVSDGQQILVGAPPGAGAAPTSGGQAGVGAGSSLVNLNTASLEQLDALPGVGPALAQHILDWRTAHGQFASIDQLREVSGIGDSKFASLEPLVTV